MGQAGAAAELPARLAVLVEPLVADQGVELVDVEVKGPPNKRVVRLVTDVDGGLDIDRIVAVSKAVGDLIDDEVKGSYTLEVTSVGLDRPLTGPRDFARNLGRDVAVHLAGAEEGQEPLAGVVASVDADLTLEVDGEQRVIPFDEIDHAMVVLPW